MRDVPGQFSSRRRTYAVAHGRVSGSELRCVVTSAPIAGRPTRCMGFPRAVARRRPSSTASRNRCPHCQGAGAALPLTNALAELPRGAPTIDVTKRSNARAARPCRDGDAFDSVSICWEPVRLARRRVRALMRRRSLHPGSGIQRRRGPVHDGTPSWPCRECTLHPGTARRRSRLPSELTDDSTHSAVHREKESCAFRHPQASPCRVF